MRGHLNDFRNLNSIGSPKVLLEALRDVDRDEKDNILITSSSEITSASIEISFTAGIYRNAVGT